MFSEWLEVYDDCTFTIDGNSYTAVIKKINDDSLEVQPVRVNYESNIDRDNNGLPKFDMLVLSSTAYEDIN